MAAQPVQISLDSELLARIDDDQEARDMGRSAFIRRAVRLYLAAKRRRAIDDEIRSAFASQADTMLDEVADLLDHQEWPPA